MRMPAGRLNRRMKMTLSDRGLPALAASWLVVMGCAAPSMAKTTGVGDVTRGPVSFRVAAFQPLAHFGADGVRVTYAAALGGEWSMELHPVDARLGTGDILFYRSDDRSVRSARSRRRIEFGTRILLHMPRREYDTLVAKIDAALAQPDPPVNQGADPCPPTKPHCVVCDDGPDYLTERRKHGRTQWIDLSDCDDGARFADVARLIVGAFPALQCWLLPEDKPDVCHPSRPQDDKPSN
jgi:hypothetical protein